jgi:ABC-type glutathione transport system ATPase component
MGLLKAVGMADQATKRPDQLSGGQKQRVAVARALVANSKLVLADEPTANLDHDTAYRIIGLMRKMRDELKTTFVFSTHDPKIMREAEVTFMLEDGRPQPVDCAGAALYGHHQRRIAAARLFPERWKRHGIRGKAEQSPHRVAGAAVLLAMSTPTFTWCGLKPSSPEYHV